MLRDMIEHQLVTCEPSSELPYVAELMRKENVGAVLVCDSGRKPVGIVTDRDIVLRCISEGKDPNSCTAGDVMSKTIQFVKETDGIYDVISMMKKAQVRRIPIVDESGFAVGMISQGDVIALLGRELHDIAESTTNSTQVEEDAEANFNQKAA